MSQTFLAAVILIFRRFRWVVCQIDYLCDCAHDEERREALTKLPPNLPDSYYRLLERVNRFSPRTQTMVQLCLHFIAFANPKLSIPQLRQAVSTPETLGAHLDPSNMIPEREISRRCSSLIRKSECGKHFEFAHFSVQEFLENEAALSTASSPSLKCYLISKSRSYALLAAQCLRFLQLSNFNLPSTTTTQDLVSARDRSRKYPFYKYSAINWPYFTKYGLDAVTLGLAKSLFHPVKTKHFTLWTVELICHVSNDTARGYAYQVISDDNFRPLHLASTLNLDEVCEFLLEGGTDINLRSRVGRPIDLAMISIHAIAESTINLVKILPCTERRNRTIDCLINKGAKLSNSIATRRIESVFFIAGELATNCFDGDFTPIIGLLSLGVIPGEIEIQDFKHQIYNVRGCSKAELSTRKLIQYLFSASSFETEWGFQIGSIIWQWALKRNLAYTDDPFFIDSRISLSEEALITKVETAVQLDNIDVVKMCMDDVRLNPLTLRLKDDKTLLHVAVECASVDTIGLLLDAGCSSEVLDRKGSTPLHSCLDNQNQWVLDPFIEREISLLSPDAEGCTIWHLWAQNCGPDDLLEDLFKRDFRATSEALLMKTPEGFTPLSLSLEAAGNAEERAIAIIELSASIPSFWQSHDPMFGAAAKQGYEKVIHCLKNVNAKLDPVSPGTCTPFHQLCARVSLECVELLKSLFGDIHRWRFRGRLPVELYIKKVLQEACYQPDTKVIEALTSPDILQDEDDEGKTPWEFVCSLQAQVYQNIMLDCYTTTGWSRIKAIHSVVSTYMEIGLHRAYEDQRNESVIPLLLSPILRLNGQVPQFSCLILSSVLHQWIALTRFWPSAKKSHEVLRYLKAAIKDCNLDVVVLLVDNGVDIYQRIEGASAIDYACKVFVEHTYLTEPHHNLYRILEILLAKLSEEPNQERLVEFLFSEGLHSLATRKNIVRFHWLISQFIKIGVSTSAQAQTELRRHRGSKALMCHISLNSECAGLLLRVGADPTVASSLNHSLNAIQIASLQGDLVFLRSVLEHATAGRFVVDWMQPFGCSFEIGRQLGDFQGANALHIASATGKIECLRFYLDETTPETLIADINAAASVGGYTPLHVAAFFDNINIMDLLLSRGADPMYEDDCRRTPLHMAAGGGHLAATTATTATRLLLERGSSETFDISGRKPRAYATGPYRNDILRCLDRVSRDETNNGTRVLSSKDIFALSQTLEDAILKGDLQKCLSTFAFGCPINMQMPSCLGCSPLILAMVTSEPKLMIIKWLLENGASVLKSACQAHGMLSPVEIAAKNSQLNSLLPQLFDEYLSQGGELVVGDDYPVHAAASSQNNEGLELLLEHIEKQIDTIV